MSAIDTILNTLTSTAYSQPDVNVIWSLAAIPIIFYLPGLVIFNAFINESTVVTGAERIFLRILTSILISGLIGLIIAEIGLFSLINLLIIVAAMTGSIAYIYRRKIAIKCRPPVHIDRSLIALILIVLLSAMVYLSPSPYILGDRDPGVYVNTGINIAKTGAILVHDTYIDSIDPEIQDLLYFPDFIFRDIGYNYQYQGFFITDQSTGEVTPQFYYLWTIWIAISYAMFGLDISLYITPLFAILSVFGIYMAASAMFNRNVGLLSSLLLSISYAQIWYAREPATEIFTQFLIFSGLFTFIIFAKSRDRYMGVLSALCFGEALLTRIDSMYLIIPLALYFGYKWITGSIKKDHAYFLITFALMGLLAGITAVVISTPYTLFSAKSVLAGAGQYLSSPGTVFIGSSLLMMMVGGLYLARGAIPSPDKDLMRYARHAMILVITACILYGYFIRPEGNIPGDSYNLVKLSWYLGGLIGILLAGAGCMHIIYKKPCPEVMLFVGIFLVYAFMYIHSAMIAPDHPWWVRRFVPVVLPAAIICISYVIDLTGKLNTGKYGRLVISAAIIVLTILPSAYADTRLIGHTQYENMAVDVGEIAEMMKDNGPIVYNRNYYSNKIVTPLHYIYGKDSVVLNRTLLTPELVSGHLLKDQKMYVLDFYSDEDIFDNGNEVLTYTVRWPVTQYDKWTPYLYFYLPGESRIMEHTFNIEVVECLDDWNESLASDDAWYDLEVWNGIPTRWQSNNATIRVYSEIDGYADLKFNIISFYRENTLNVYVNDEKVHEQVINTGVTGVDKKIELKEGYNVIRFYSQEGWLMPSEVADNGDHRRLSFAFQNVTIE